MKNSLSKTIFTCILSGFILYGCTNTVVIMNQKYKDKDLSSRSILIMPLSEAAVTSQNKDIATDNIKKVYS